MSGKTYALLVGLDEFSAGLPPLSGCANDVTRFEDYLRDHFRDADPRVEILVNGDATRDNVIRTFREHLGEAGPDDVALFMYCGYGARTPSASGFEGFSFDGKDEGLVCYDSRTEGYPDLADKELAALLHELTRQNDPHVAVILDCCHTGTEIESPLGRARFTGAGEARPADGYLDGYYRDVGDNLFIPDSRHIMLAACNRSQTAREQADGGLFSRSMLGELQRGEPMTYAELFTRCRVAIKRLTHDQDPEFECFGRFDVNAGFLGGRVGRDARATVYVEDGLWTMDRGAFYGLPTDPDREVRVEVYNGDEYVGTGRATEVLGATSRLTITSPRGSVVEADPDAGYYGVIATLPVAPLAVRTERPGRMHKLLRRKVPELRNTRPPIHGVELVEDPVDTGYTLSVEDSDGIRTFALELPRSTPPLRVLGPPGDAEGIDKSEYMAGVLEAAGRFERLLNLQNHDRRLSTSVLDVALRVRPGTPEEHRDDDGQLTIEFSRAPGDADGWSDIPYTLEATNRHTAPLYVALSFLSERLGIETIKAPDSSVWKLAPGETRQLDANEFTLGAELVETENNFLLLVSTREIPSVSLIEQDEVPDRYEAMKGRGSKQAGAEKADVGNDWFTKRIQVRLKGQ
jgi:hypothetical protein